MRRTKFAGKGTSSTRANIKCKTESALAAEVRILKPGRLISPPGTYFVTFSTWRRRRLFVVEAYVRLFLKTLYLYRRQGACELHAFVVMPDHVHILLTPDLNVTLEHAV